MYTGKENAISVAFKFSNSPLTFIYSEYSLILPVEASANFISDILEYKPIRIIKTAKAESKHSFFIKKHPFFPVLWNRKGAFKHICIANQIRCIACLTLLTPKISRL